MRKMFTIVLLLFSCVTYAGLGIEPGSGGFIANTQLLINPDKQISTIDTVSPNKETVSVSNLDSTSPLSNTFEFHQDTQRRHMSLFSKALDTTVSSVALTLGVSGGNSKAPIRS